MKRTLLSRGNSGERSCTASAPEGSAPQLRYGAPFAVRLIGGRSIPQACPWGSPRDSDITARWQEGSVPSEHQLQGFPVLGTPRSAAQPKVLPATC